MSGEKWNCCAECGGVLNSMNKPHGWVTVQIGRAQARVHTLCRSAFAKRSFDDQQERAQWRP